MKIFGYLLLGLSTASGDADPDVPGGPQYYLLQGPHETAKEKAAAAGAQVLWSHAETELTYVSSDNSNFLDDLNVEDSDGVIESATDFAVEWQHPLSDSGIDNEIIEPTITGNIIDLSEAEYFSLQWNMMEMEAPAAWAQGCTGAGVRIAIIDSGINPNHPDLASNMDLDCSASFWPPEPWYSDTNWHGMLVAGVAAANGNVLGVAPQATIISVKGSHGSIGSFGSIIGAVLYASNPAALGRVDCDKADIINLSLGHTFPKRGGTGPLVSAVAKAVNYAASQGTLVISSMGNDGIDLGQAKDTIKVPAESGSALAITATGPNREPALYSNYGEGSTFVAAPGGEVSTGNVVIISPESISGPKTAGAARFGPIANKLTGKVVLFTDSFDTTGDYHDACESEVQDANVNGKIALIHRGTCIYTTKVLAAQASGAIGVIISNNVGGTAPTLGGDDPTITIPTLSITWSDGQEIEDVLGTDQDVIAELTSTVRSDLEKVLTTCNTITGYCFQFGTSLAAPAAAGVAALILGNNPGMSLGKLKTALKNSADDEGPVGKDEFYGHGFVNARRACGL